MQHFGYSIGCVMDTLKGRKRWSDEALIARALSVKTRKAYRANLQELRFRASASLYERCIELAKSELPEEREVGVDILAEFFRRDKRKKYGYESPYSKDRLALFLQMIVVEKNINVIESLLHGIGKNDCRIKSKDIDLILPFIDHENRSVRWTALIALMNSPNNMKAIRGLIKLSNDRYADIRDWATFTIGTQSELDNDEIRKALYARCTDKHLVTRHEAICGLAKRKDAGVKKYIEKALASHDVCTTLIFESIRELDAKEYLPHLEAMLAETENDPSIRELWLDELKECIEALRGSPQDT